jgi:carboxyl-terminal processing protease
MRKTKYVIVLAVFQLACWLFVPTLLGAPAGDASESLVEPAPATKQGEPNKIEAEPNLVSVPVAGDSASIINQLCSNIYKGDFAAARALLGGSTKSKSTAIKKLIDIISEYEAIEQRRKAAQETAYKERLAELEKLSAASSATPNSETLLKAGQAKADACDVSRPAEGQNVGDVNDANSISNELLVIAKASELANEQQKKELLSRPYVKQTIQKAIDKAAKYESQGKWLDAYITCYSWLQAIEPDNKEIEDYAEKLVEKASIEASFEDSPCETREERFHGVKKDVFVWAITSLKSNYIDIIDYKQMATKAIKRCKLMGEVYSKLDENRESGIEHREAAWSAALAAVLSEVEQSPAGFSHEEFVDVFEKVLTLNVTTIELPQEVLIAQFADASFSTLDPYTTIVWPRQMKDFQKVMTNEFTGIGIEITKQKGLLTVASLLLDTPAYNSGLDAGDVIEKVDGVETKDMTLTCAVDKIMGPKGTKVTLTIRRAAEEETRDITMTRAKITVPTLRGWQRTTKGEWLYMTDEPDKIGYLRISSFSEKTSADLEKVLNNLEAEGLKGLILDLRFNTGGILDSAVEVTDKFIKEGLIVRTERGFGKGLVYEVAHEKNTHPNYPLIILINSSSASASEIVAGALADKEHNRAILVGERTYGKGSVQGITYYPLGGAQLKYTMAYYHLPSGQRVESAEARKKLGKDDWGVGPNIEVKLTSDELKKMLDVQRDNDVLSSAIGDSSKQRTKKYTIKETLDADPQLAAGLLVVKSKLIEAEAQECARVTKDEGRGTN